MTPESQLRLEKIRRVSRTLQWALKVVIGFLAMELLVETIMLASGRGGGFRFHGADVSVAGLSLLRRLQLLGMVGTSSFFLLRALYDLHELFGNYARGEIFTRDSARRLRWMGTLYMVWSCVNMFSVPWVYFITFTENSPNVYRVDVNVSSILAGAFVVLISWFMDMAAEMREENELTI